MTAALEGGEWSAACPGRALPRQRPGTYFTGGWVGIYIYIYPLKISLLTWFLSISILHPSPSMQSLTTLQLS